MSAAVAVKTVNLAKIVVIGAFGVLTVACRVSSSAQEPQRIVVQGAMDSETKELVASLEQPVQEQIGGWTFWTGTFGGVPVVVSKTMKGMENSAAATAIAASHYRPIAIINQGTAGGHHADLHVFDVVLGVESVNLGSFKTPFRDRNAGTRAEDWSPLDLLRSEGSAGMDPQALTMRRFRADESLLEIARQMRAGYKPGRVVDGVIGSADVWNSELDRIAEFHDRFGTSVEEMETAAAAQVAAAFHIPFLGIRVVSNNVTNGERYDARAGEACQEFVSGVVRGYFSRAKR